jgi:hypothetical protein
VPTYLDPLGREYQSWVALTDRYAAKLKAQVPSLPELKHIAIAVDRLRVAFAEEREEDAAVERIDRATASGVKRTVWRLLLRRALGWT